MAKKKKKPKKKQKSPTAQVHYLVAKPDRQAWGSRVFCSKLNPKSVTATHTKVTCAKCRAFLNWSPTKYARACMQPLRLEIS